MNAENMKGEIGLFIGAALLITSLIFFFFFRSFRATFISMCILIFGVMWSFGTLGIIPLRNHDFNGYNSSIDYCHRNSELYFPDQ